MKMTKRKTALFAVFAVAVVAMAGVGYAVAYNALTTSYTNTDAVTNAYASVYLTDNTAYTAGYSIKVYYDTETSGSDGSTITYDYNSADSLRINFKVKQINDNTTLKLTMTAALEIPGADVKWSLDGGAASASISNATVTASEAGAAHYIDLVLTKDNSVLDEVPANSVSFVVTLSVSASA